MPETAAVPFDAAPARDPAAPIKLALAFSAVIAVGLLAWNVLAILA